MKYIKEIMGEIFMCLANVFDILAEACRGGSQSELPCGEGVLYDDTNGYHVNGVTQHKE